MTTIDSYLLRQFARVFAMTFISLLGIFVVADFVGNLAEFVDYGNESQSLWGLLASYYGARVPWFFDIAGRNIALLSAVFAVAWLQRDNELTALMAAGISRWRIVKPLILACSVIAVLAVANRELALPRFRRELCRNPQDLIRNQPEKITPKYDVTDVLFDGKSLYPREQRIESPRFVLPVTWKGVGNRLIAGSAVYQPATPDRPSGYLLQDVQSNIPLHTVASMVVNDRPLVITAHDDSSLTNSQAFLVSNMSVDQLRRGRQWQQYSSTMPLIVGLRTGGLDDSPDLLVMLHSRFVQPLLDVTLVFLGLPLAFGSDRRQIVWSTTKSLLAVAGFAVVVLISHGMGIQCIVSPALAAWLPAFILVPLAFLASGPLRR